MCNALFLLASCRYPTHKNKPTTYSTSSARRNKQHNLYLKCTSGNKNTHSPTHTVHRHTYALGVAGAIIITHTLTWRAGGGVDCRQSHQTYTRTPAHMLMNNMFSECCCAVRGNAQSSRNCGIGAEPHGLRRHSGRNRMPLVARCTPPPGF